MYQSNKVGEEEGEGGGKERKSIWLTNVCLWSLNGYISVSLFVCLFVFG